METGYAVLISTAMPKTSPGATKDHLWMAFASARDHSKPLVRHGCCPKVNGSWLVVITNAETKHPDIADLVLVSESRKALCHIE